MLRMTRNTHQRILLLLTFACALLVPCASAVAAQGSIYDDAADGYLDGDYTLSQVQDADSSVPTQIREYTLWDDIVAEYMRRLRDPDAPREPIAEVLDYNDNGIIDQEDVEEARDKTQKLRRVARAEAREAREDGGGDENGRDDDEGSAIPAAGDDDDGSDGSGGDGLPLLWLSLLIFVPMFIVGLGIWRMQRDRAARIAKDGADEGFDTPAVSGPAEE